MPIEKEITYLSFAYILLLYSVKPIEQIERQKQWKEAWLRSVRTVDGKAMEAIKSGPGGAQAS